MKSLYRDHEGILARILAHFPLNPAARNPKLLNAIFR